MMHARTPCIELHVKFEVQVGVNLEGRSTWRAKSASVAGVGEREDREPVYAGDGEWGPVCPMCGHLIVWSEAARSCTLAEAGMATREHVRIEIGS
jgi:hypothetical protein